MGKSLLVAIGIAITLSSLIPVDSSDKIIAPRYLTRISFGLQNSSQCEFNVPFHHKSDDSSLRLETVSPFYRVLSAHLITARFLVLGAIHS